MTRRRAHVWVLLAAAGVLAAGPCIGQADTVRPVRPAIWGDVRPAPDPEPTR